MVRRSGARHPAAGQGRTRWIRRPLTAATVAAAVAALMLVGVRSGYSADRPHLRSGAAWLPSALVGQLTLLDGSAVEVSAQVQAAGPGERLEAVQQGKDAYAVNGTTGTVRRVDGASFQLSPPATPIDVAGDGLRVLAGAGTLYALDARRGAVVAADPRTLVASTRPIALARQIAEQTAVVGDDGRLWIIDPITGDLIMIDGSSRTTRRGAVRPGKAVVTLARGVPVVVDVSRRVAMVLDPKSGATVRTITLDLSPDDTVQVTGSRQADRFHVVTSRGLLATCALKKTSCDGGMLLHEGGDLGMPVETSGRVFVPDRATGKVWVVDPGASRVIAQPQVVTPRAHFQLVTRDGIVFFNDPDSPQAGVVRLDGDVRTVSKYDPSDPGRGVTLQTSDAGQPVRPLPAPSGSLKPAPGASPPATTGPSESASPRPSRTAPSNPAPPTTSQPPRSPSPSSPSPSPSRTQQAEITISVSASTVRVGQDVTVEAAVTGGTPSGIEWTFGDGGTATGSTAAHHWANAAPYQVSARATFAGRSAVSASTTIQVVAQPVLTVQVQGSGTVTGGDISCPSTCTGTVTYGESVTLQATPAAGATIGSWGGACSGSATTCTVAMDADRTVTITFRTTPPAAPTLISPIDNAYWEQICNKDGTVCGYEWSAVTGAAQYRIEFERDSSSSGNGTSWEAVSSQTVTTTSVSRPVDNALYCRYGRWRVTAIAADGTVGTPSGYRRLDLRCRL